MEFYIKETGGKKTVFPSNFGVHFGDGACGLLKKKEKKERKS